MTEQPSVIRRKRLKGDTTFDLGLDIALRHLKQRGERFTQKELAAFCDVSPQRINELEQKALAKLRMRCKLAGIPPEALEIFNPNKGANPYESGAPVVHQTYRPRKVK